MTPLLLMCLILFPPSPRQTQLLQLKQVQITRQTIYSFNKLVWVALISLLLNPINVTFCCRPQLMTQRYAPALHLHSQHIVPPPLDDTHTHKHEEAHRRTPHAPSPQRPGSLAPVSSGGSDEDEKEG